jgi:Sulfotransferase domain
MPVILQGAELNMALQVIGTGFGRTGTDSMREALNMLGFGPCHHMFEVIEHDEQKQLWRALAKGATPDWDRLFAGYTSCMDWPSAHYWRDLVRFYPEARVILTYRSPESWWTSFEKTVLQVVKNSVEQDSLGIALVAKQVFGDLPWKFHPAAFRVPGICMPGWAGCATGWHAEPRRGVA